jgi:dipeptidyl aminopeptidase/acylaminoacyl peptidase
MFRATLVGVLLCLVVDAAFADAPAPVPVEAFFANHKVSSVQVSPDGKYLAVVVSDKVSGEGNKFLTVLGTDDRKIKTSFQVSENQVIWHYWWANGERVLVATSTQTGALSVATFDGALYAVNVDGSQPVQLLGDMPDTGPTAPPPIKDNADNFSHIQRKGETKSKHVNHFFDGMLYIPRHDTHHVLIEGWSTDSEHPQALDVDVYSGEVMVVAESPIDGGEFLADADGHVRVAWGFKSFDGSRQLFYRDVGDAAKWQDLSALYKGLDPADYDTGPLRMAQDGKTFYWRGRTPDSTLGLFSVDPANLSVKSLFSDPTFDIETFIYGDYEGNDHKILAVETYPGLPELHVIDAKETETAVLLALRQAFPGQEVDITSATRDGTTMVVYVGSDRNPGDYYLFNAKTLKADWLFNRLEQIDPDKMADMQPVNLKTRDGLTLYGYLTAPANKPRKNLPLILLPHGGPHNLRDYWGWDPEAQYFANRGYAVLQVNYRGSGGYGLKFQSLGYRNWGTTMQDDLADAVHWAVNQGIADPNRICIYGASYGGYAALENPIRYPQLYKCAVGYVGVYDLTLEAKYGDVHRSANGRNYLEIVRGNDKAELRKYSPAYNADKITIPVFIAYGGKDVRVVPDNAKELIAAMDAAGKKYELLFDPYEIHGFGKPEDKFELYTRIVKFIDANIGEGAAGASNTAVVNPSPP